MGADAALISSFSRLADADKRDYSRQLQLQKEGGDIPTEGITKTAGIIAKGFQDRADAYKEQNEQNKLDNQKRGTELNKAIKKENERINKGGGLQEDVGDAFRNGLKEGSEKYKSYNPTGGERQSVEDKDNQLKEFNNITNLEKEIVRARTIFGTDVSVSVDATTPEAMEIYSKCLNSNDHDDVKSSIVDGKLQYEITTPAYIDPISQQEITPASTEIYDLDRLEEILIPEATKTETFILKSGKEFGKLGAKERYGEVTPEMLWGEADKIADELEKDPRILADIAQRRIGARPATKDAVNDTGNWSAGTIAYRLQDNPALNTTVYEAAGFTFDGADGSEPDNKISQAEMEAVMTGANRDIVISTIVNPNYINPITTANHYNHKTSCEIVSMEIAKEHAQYYLDKQKATFKEEDGNKGKDNGGYEEITGDK